MKTHSKHNHLPKAQNSDLIERRIVSMSEGAFLPSGMLIGAVSASVLYGWHRFQRVKSYEIYHYCWSKPQRKKAENALYSMTGKEPPEILQEFFWLPIKYSRDWSTDDSFRNIEYDLFDHTSTNPTAVKIAEALRMTYPEDEMLMHFAGWIEEGIGRNGSFLYVDNETVRGSRATNGKRKLDWKGLFKNVE